jgi:hypothetical protein
LNRTLFSRVAAFLANPPDKVQLSNIMIAFDIYLLLSCWQLAPMEMKALADGNTIATNVPKDQILLLAGWIESSHINGDDIVDCSEMWFFSCLDNKKDFVVAGLPNTSTMMGAKISEEGEPLNANVLDELKGSVICNYADCVYNPTFDQCYAAGGLAYSYAYHYDFSSEPSTCDKTFKPPVEDEKWSSEKVLAVASAAAVAGILVLVTSLLYFVYRLFVKHPTTIITTSTSQ